MTEEITEKFVFFVRHGETDCNKNKLWQGALDPPLNEDGKKQAALCAKVIKSIVKDNDLIIKNIFSSPQIRAIQTAERMSRALNLPIIKKNGLKEINHGICEGMTHAEIKEKHPQIWSIYKKDRAKLWFPEGESILDAYTRVKSDIYSIVQFDGDFSAILIVGHGASIGLSIIAMLNWPIATITGLGKIDNTGISVVRIVDETISLIKYNWLPHANEIGDEFNIRRV